MISHEHRCIFIHIPRTAGTSIEKSITGSDWWSIKPSTKHILASTAKNIYREYWDDYFKFSFVRNPWDRMVSLIKFSGFYGANLEKENKKINVSCYLKKFPDVEIDPRSESKDEKIKANPNSVYLNIINEPLDFIGKFENLQQDFNTVCNEIGIAEQELPRLHKSNHKHHQHYTEYYDDETRSIVAKKYAKDIEYFGYEFGE